MVARIWLLLLALLMVAAPGEAVAEVVDVPSYTTTADDDTATGPIAVAHESPPRVVHLPSAPETIRPTPALARVFRPPRPAFD